MSFVTKIKESIRAGRARKFYGKLIHENDLCFDIGANRGEKSKLFLALGARVVAVEPQASCMADLNLLQAKYGDRSTIIQKAVADKRGKAKLHIGNINLISTLSEKFIERFESHKELHWKRSEEVDVTTLDELIAEFGVPNFCKIDTEGYEKKVLEGLSKKISLIEFEFTFPLLDETKKCIEELSKFGNAEYNYIFYELPVFKLSAWCDKETMLNELDKIPSNVIHGNIYVRFKE